MRSTLPVLVIAGLVVASALVWAPAAWAEAGAGVEEGLGGAPGVNPADNVTKLEVIPKYIVLDNDANASIFSTTIKYDKALGPVNGFNVELPLLRFESPAGSDTGIGDLEVAFRKTLRGNPWTCVVGVEGILPTATADSLGSGKWQLNPSAAAVYQLAPYKFLAVAAKHLLSVAGDDDRPDVSTGVYRLIYGVVGPKGSWWVLDQQAWVDFKNHEGTEWLTEAEVGKMVGPTTGAWLRAGAHVGGGWERQDWSFTAGMRFISF